MRHRPSPFAFLGALLAAVLALGLVAPAATAATTRSLSVRTSSTGVLAGKAVTFSGTLTHSPKGSKVTVQRKSGTKWVAAKSTATKTAAGAWSVRVALPTKVGTYVFRAVAPKTGSLKTATSASVRVAALRKTAVTVKATPHTVKAGSSATFSGTVKPFVRNGGVTIQRLAGQRWVTAGTTKVSARGTYSTAIAVNVSAVFRAVSARAGLNAPGTSFSAVVITSPVIANSSLPNGSVGSSYSATLKVIGDVSGTWTAAPLPAGLALNASTGRISGTPTTAGATEVTINFTQSVSGQKAPSKKLTLTVTEPQPPVITTADPLPGAKVGVAYSVQLDATNGPGTWTTTAALPGGLSLSSGGLLSGTPTTAASSTVSVKFTNNASGLFATKTFGLTVSPPPPPPTITTSSLPAGEVGKAYTTTLAAGGASGTWSTSALPGGLTLNPSTGAITGTPTTAATTQVTINFTQTGNPTPAAPVVLSLKVNPPVPVILTTSLPDARIGRAYSATLTVSGGVAGTWKVTGLSGTGLSVNTHTGVISGTAIALVPTTKTLTVEFTQTGGVAAQPKTLTLHFANAAPGS